MCIPTFELFCLKYSIAPAFLQGQGQRAGFEAHKQKNGIPDRFRFEKIPNKHLSEDAENARLG